MSKQRSFKPPTKLLQIELKMLLVMNKDCRKGNNGTLRKPKSHRQLHSILLYRFSIRSYYCRL